MSKMIATGCQNKAMSYVRCTCRCLKVIPTTLLNFPSEFNCRIKKPKGPRDPPAEWSRVERWHSSHIPGLDTSLCLTSNGNGLFIYFYLLWTSTVCDHRNTVNYLSIFCNPFESVYISVLVIYITDERKNYIKPLSILRQVLVLNTIYRLKCSAAIVWL